MISKFIFFLEKISYSSKTPYTLMFIGECSNSNGRVLKLKYTGADLSNETGISIPSTVLESLKEQLNEKFGYGPFDSKSARSILKQCNEFVCRY